MARWRQLLDSVLSAFTVFAPLVTVHVKGVAGYYIRQQSYWQTFGGFIFFPLGLVALGAWPLCLLAIGYGAYVHSVRYEARGRLLLWCGTALLAIVLVSSTISLSFWPVNLPSLSPMTLVAPYLLPSLGLALLASGPHRREMSTIAHRDTGTAAHNWLRFLPPNTAHPSARAVTMSLCAAQRPRSRLLDRAAIRSGKRSGVQAKDGMPSAASGGRVALVVSWARPCR